MRASEPRGADAEVVGAVAIARAAVLAGLPGAVVDGDFAFGASETWGAGAGVAPLARVEASTAVTARLVVRAEVQVLVAEETTPALVAKAIPWLHAGTMHAAWVPSALVAIGAFPA